jgi:hypothetical protein
MLERYLLLLPVIIMTIKILIQYPCGCHVIDAKTKYTNPEAEYSLQICPQHKKEIGGIK